MDDHDGPTAETLDIAQYATHGFCPGFTLKRHRYETLANAGSHEARTDWAHYIGPSGEFGGCNPVNGNFTSLVVPLCRPDRLRLVAYVIESDSSRSGSGDEFSLGERETASAKVKAGRKQLQAKMMLQLNATDNDCAARIMDAWKTMLSTTIRDKDRDFSDLEDYLNFRIIDTGALWTESVMLFGMGMILTREEDARLAHVVRPCYASLALANDYFSFDREWAEAQSKPGAAKPINAVWLYMRWCGVSPEEAKRLVVEAANRYETRFRELCERLRRDDKNPLDPKLERYLRALSYEISGNVVWSLNCPRYHPEYRYDPNAGIEDGLTADHRGADLRVFAIDSNDEEEEQEEEERRRSVASTASSCGLSDADAHTACSESWDRALSPRSSISSLASSAVAGQDDEHGHKAELDGRLPDRKILGAEHLNAPFAYMKGLPSKGVRDKLAEAINLWAGLPEDTVEQIKEVVGDLHTASLMQDDIEDGSDLRRGYPAAHSVFGVAQTLNAASFAVVEALRKTHALPSTIPGASDIAFEQLRELHIGQSHDLHWTRHTACPTEEEYLEMVSKKTGGLFRLLSRLMCSHLDTGLASAIDNMVSQLGIYFQIRDDYENLNSAEYTSQKGFCEDLDEGKFSFPLVHFFTSAGTGTTTTAAAVQQVREVLEQRRETARRGLAPPLSEAHKKLVLQHLADSGALDHARDTLRRRQAGIRESVAGVERRTGKVNWVLRFCLLMLSV
ncbi:terpenoid synthase [Parathielavia hyrcaniae]|uniref:Terpenoid synthase n=1 Tax=Parathielavia hyrcaniae TaxID=113614 RepID=A0AAN6PZJ1_9PEZI|nr:terpenoid synthase [Parathielavia hyrcaniae]